MKLVDLKDDAGISLQVLAENLVERTRKHDLTFVFVFLDKKDGGLHVMSNVENVPSALIRLGQSMREDPLATSGIGSVDGSAN